MNKTRLFGAALALGMVASAGHEVRATGPSANVVIEWNQILNDTVPVPHGVGTPRFYAMTHIAMFDAINTIERDFEPYRVQLRLRAAGRRKPPRRRRPTMCSWRSTPPRHPPMMRRSRGQLGTHPSGFVRLGAAIGAQVAKEILAWRQNDGWVVTPFPPYSEPPLPGRWQPTAAE